METTFGVRFGAVTTVIAETPEYETRVMEAMAPGLVAPANDDSNKCSSAVGLMAHQISIE